MKSKKDWSNESLPYPIDSSVRESIRDLDAFLREQDPDSLSLASSQFTEQLGGNNLTIQPSSETGHF